MPLLDGLEQVHNAGFLHRDIKPANILLNARGDPTLIDFGASRAALAGRSISMTAVFTLGYAAAEQMTTAKQGPWTDIYALSATLYHAITGQAPPHAIDRMMMNDSCQQLTKLAPPGFSRALLVGLDAGLAMRVDDRPQSIAGWRRLLGLNDAAALPASAAAARTYRRTLSISVGIAAALLLIGGGYLAFEPGTSGKAVPVDLAAEVQRAREALAVAEQRAKQREEEEAQVQRKAQQEVADRQRAEEEARRAAAARLERDRAEAEPARQKAEQEAANLKAEAEARQQAESEAALKRQREEEARRQAEVEQAEKNRLEQEVSAKAEAEKAATQQKLDDEQSKVDAEKSAARARQDNDRKTAEAAENVLRLSQPDRQRIQLALTSLGFDTRGNDGVLGPRSREMIAGWQKARNQAPTGYLTGAQNQALLREAATALARHDDDQKKADEENKKAEEARTRTTAAVPALPTAAPPEAAAVAGAGFDGSYGGSYTQFGGGGAGGAASLRSVSIRIAGATGTGTVTHPACGSAPISIRVSRTGEISGAVVVPDPVCGPIQGSFTGRVANGQLEFAVVAPGARGTGILTRGAAAPAVPPAASPSTAATPGAAAANPLDGTYSGSLTQGSSAAVTMAIRSVSIRITGATGTGTVTHPSCGSASVSLRVSSAGDISGEGMLFEPNCGPVQGTFTGRVGNGQLQLTAVGPGTRGVTTLTRTGN
jgi:Protein kinase domain